MHRKLCRRYDIPGHAHALTFSCYRRLRLLSKDRTRGWMVEALARAPKQAGFHVWACVIMPEHVHLPHVRNPQRIDFMKVCSFLGSNRPISNRRQKKDL